MNRAFHLTVFAGNSKFHKRDLARHVQERLQRGQREENLVVFRSAGGEHSGNAIGCDRRRVLPVRLCHTVQLDGIARAYMQQYGTRHQGYT